MRNVPIHSAVQSVVCRRPVSNVTGAEGWQALPFPSVISTSTSTRWRLGSGAPSQVIPRVSVDFTKPESQRTLPLAGSVAVMW